MKLNHLLQRSDFSGCDLVMLQEMRAKYSVICDIDRMIDCWFSHQNTD